MVWLPPTRSNSCSWRKRSSLTWMRGEISPISSRNSVPPSACSKRPSRRAARPVKAPRSWPNSSLSSRVSASAAQCSLTKGPPARGLCSWMAAATSSLPVPLSPVMQHRRARRRHLQDGVEHLLHGGARADDALDAVPRGQPLAQVAGLGAQRLRSSSRREHQHQLLDVDRLGQVVGGALAHGRDRACRPRRTRSSRRRRAPGRARAPSRISSMPVEARHLQVGQDEVGRELVELARALKPSAAVSTW